MKCKNKELLKKITVEKLDKFTEVSFAVLGDLPDCRTISANKYYDSESVANFNKYMRPKNQFECGGTGCLTGTLTLGANGHASYYAKYDATEFSSGAIAFYAKASGTGAIGAKFEVFVSDDKNFTNADKYTFTVPYNYGVGDGFYPVVIDLSQTPAEVVGTGWTASQRGAYIKIDAVAETDENETLSNFSISSIAVYDSIHDFELNDVVKVSCLSGIEGTEDIEAAEATCRAGGYNTDTAPTFTKTVTGSEVTPNYRKLNPFVGRGTSIKGFIDATVDKKVLRGENGYGYVVLPDMADECGWVYASIVDACDITNAKLERLSIPALVKLDDNQYLVMRDSEGITTLYFNEALIGMDVRISYPKEAGIKEEYVADFDNIGTVRTKMFYAIKQSDDITVMRVYNNVLVTSFPATINTEETSFAFTITVQMDEDGHYYREWVIEDTSAHMPEK